MPALQGLCSHCNPSASRPRFPPLGMEWDENGCPGTPWLGDRAATDTAALQGWHPAPPSPGTESPFPNPALISPVRSQRPNPTCPFPPCSSLSQLSLKSSLRLPNSAAQPGIAEALDRPSTCHQRCVPAVFAQLGTKGTGRGQPRGTDSGCTDLLPAPSSASLPEDSWMKSQPLQAPRERCAAGMELPGLRTCLRGGRACPALPLPHTRAGIPSESSLSCWEPPLPSRGQ